MYKETSLVSSPPVWVLPTESDFEHAKARFLSGDDDGSRFGDNKLDIDESEDSPF